MVQRFCHNRVSLDFDIDFGSLFELYFAPIRIRQTIRNANLAIEMIRSLDGDLGFFGLAGAGMRMDNFLDFPYQRGTCLGRFGRHGYTLPSTLPTRLAERALAALDRGYSPPGFHVCAIRETL